MLTKPNSSSLGPLLLGVILVAALWFAVLFVVEQSAKWRAADRVWHGAVVVKICHDGTRIYRLSDGRLVTGGLGASEVSSPDVCS